MINDLFNINLSLNDIVEEKINYYIDFITATTYSLNLSLIVPLTRLTYKDRDFIKKEKALKDCLSNGKLKIFYQHNKILGEEFKPKFKAAISSFCDINCIPMYTDNNAVCFHPKIIFICYKSTEQKDEYIYRLAVSSKNLTFSESIENCVILECKSNNQIRQPSNEKEFKEFVEIINGLTFDPIGASVGKVSNPNVYFSYKNNLKICEKMGLDTIKAVVAVSPGFEKNPLMNKTISSFWKEKSHSKLYFIERNNGACELWVGSANCTASGLGSKPQYNSECIVKLPLLGDVDIESIKEILISQGYKEDQNRNYENSDTSSIIDKSINDILPISIKVNQSAENDKTYEEIVKFNKAPDISENINIFVHPLGLTNQKKALEKDNPLLFQGIKLLELTPLVLLTYTSKKNKNEVIRRIIKASYDDETKHIFSEQLEEIRKYLYKNPQYIPDITNEEDCIEPKEKTATRNMPSNRHSLLLNNNNVYERFLNYYAYTSKEGLNKWKDFLILHESDYVDKDKYNYVIQLIDCLIGEV